MDHFLVAPHCLRFANAFDRLVQIIQYINIIKPDTGESSSHGSYFTTANGYLLPWIPADSFGEDDVAGHGTHTAGSAAGSTVNTPAIPVTCPAGRTVSCVGGCIDEDAGEFSDDLVSSMEQYVGADLDRMCPMFGCGAAGEDYCLTDDVSATLTSHGGVAQGAKLAIFDTFDADGLALMDFAATGMWESCMEAGCTIHSGSYGGDLECNVDAFDLMNDEFMYDVRCRCSGADVDRLNRHDGSGATSVLCCEALCQR